MRALVAALVTASLVPVASATAATPAERFPADGPDMSRAFAIGVGFWKTSPCGGQVALRWGSLEAGTRAEASWLNYEDAWANPAGNFDCAITFNAAMPFEWADLCTTVVHEMGHLLGHRHTDDAHNVMHHSAVSPLPECGGTQPRARRASTTRRCRLSRSSDGARTTFRARRCRRAAALR